ncbi:hypothetical protein [Aquipuribacter sp. SD81]|uniref:hypothetical protein n=1 Tax=Aquipuribacter sp. SD81 TaxID=3127703 RepID=UPI00301879A0
MTDDETMDAGTARAALLQADEATSRTTRLARWWVLYQAVFGVAFGALTVLLGAAEGPGDIVAPMVAFGVLVVAMAWLAVRRPVQGGFSRRVFRNGWVGTGVTYGVSLWVGMYYEWPLWGWALAAVVVAAPLLVSAALTARALR